MLHSLLLKRRQALRGIAVSPLHLKMLEPLPSWDLPEEAWLGLAAWIHFGSQESLSGLVWYNTVESKLHRHFPEYP
jgi:hypothetical protein